MKILRASLAAVATCSLLIACGDSDAPSTPEPQALLEIPRPDPQTMEDDVAELIGTAWHELDATLSNQSNGAAARADAYAQFGLACFGNGLVIPAEAAFVNATRLAPDDARWVYFLALVREFTGELEAAADGFERVLQLRTNDVPALVHLGDVRFEQARMSDARAAYSRALDADPENASAHYGLGRIASAEGDDRAAVTHFEAALALQPHADRLNYLLGLAWRNLGDMEKAQAYLAERGVVEPSFPDPLFQQISGGKARVGGLWSNMNAGSQAYVDGDYERAVGEFRQASVNHPDDPRSWQSLGMALARTGQREDAKDAYAKALALAEDNAVVHYNLAQLQIADGNLAAAERHLTRAVTIDSKKLDAHEALAQLYIRTERLEQALAQYDTALALDPQSGSLAVARAEVLVALDRNADALRALAAAAEVNPRNTSVRTAHGLMLADAGRLDDALNEFAGALEAATDDAARARVHYAFGRVHAARGDASEAIESFGQALDLNPQLAEAAQELARTLVRARQFEGAVDIYEKFLERWPNNDGARVEAAGAALLLGDGNRALRLLEAGARRDTVTPRLQSALARLLVLSGDPQIRDPNRALQLATRGYEKSGAPQLGETVALCLAATGRFDEALQLQQQLLDESGGWANANQKARLAANLERYRANSLGRLPLDIS